MIGHANNARPVYSNWAQTIGTAEISAGIRQIGGPSLAQDAFLFGFCNRVSFSPFHSVASSNLSSVAARMKFVCMGPEEVCESVCKQGRNESP